MSDLIARMFHTRYPLRGTANIRYRLGFSWICFEDEAGQTLRPPKARTWGRRGRTPVIPVSGKGAGRVSIAGLTCYQPGRRSRFIYRTIVHRRRKGERRSFSERDYISLLDAAHQQTRPPLVVIWDNLNVHISTEMRQMITARDWLHVIRPPAYAPDLNPVEANRPPIPRPSAFKLLAPAAGYWAGERTARVREPPAHSGSTTTGCTLHADGLSRMSIVDGRMLRPFAPACPSRMGACYDRGHHRQA